MMSTCTLQHGTVTIDVEAARETTRCIVLHAAPELNLINVGRRRCKTNHPHPGLKERPWFQQFNLMKETKRETYFQLEPGFCLTSELAPLPQG